jgi:hypothetical protein
MYLEYANPVALGVLIGLLSFAIALTRLKGRGANAGAARPIKNISVLVFLAFGLGPTSVMAGTVLQSVVGANQPSNSGDMPDLVEVQQASPTGLMNFPLPGTVTHWEIFFKYTTQCENDHTVMLTSPRGNKLLLMDRGQGRCSGKRETFTSSNDNDAGAFLGTRAKGNGKFVMLDLDKNDYTGTLDEVWMILTIKDKGIVSKHKLTLTGLPATIPPKK